MPIGRVLRLNSNQKGHGNEDPLRREIHDKNMDLTPELRAPPNKMPMLCQSEQHF